jgi:hypothetical protein
LTLKSRFKNNALFFPNELNLSKDSIRTFSLLHLTLFISIFPVSHTTIFYLPRACKVGVHYLPESGTVP